MKPEKKKLNLSISRVENRKEIKGLVSKDLPTSCCCCCCCGTIEINIGEDDPKTQVLN
jgi:hypothetical protein